MRTDELADRRLERTHRFAVVFPRLALREQRWRRANRVTRRIESGLHLRPAQRHRHWRTFAQSWRQWCDCCRQPVVAQVVEEDPAGALLLRHVDQITIGMVFGHPCTQRLSESFRLGPAELAAFTWC